MKRTTLTASLVGSAAAGLMAAAIAAPAWAQATTYPAGTDCGAISSAASRMECLNQQNESRQVPDPGSVAPSPDGTGNIQPGVPSSGAAAPSVAPSGTGNPSTNTPGAPNNATPQSGNPAGGSGVSN
jgi:hypothetical protein